MEPFFVKFAETVGARWRFEKVNVDAFVKKICQRWQGEHRDNPFENKSFSLNHL
jgi:uncharacterized membrane protein YjdF